MILLLAVLAGVLAGLARAGLQGRRYALPSLKKTWLILAAIFLQALVFTIPATRERISIQFVPLFLLVSQFLLLVFVWVNRSKPGFLILGLGLVMNFLVIALNGGMMPISPQVANALAPNSWELGARFGWSKDIILARDETLLWQLSDWLLTPKFLSYRYALSPGDLLLAVGAFWFLFAYEGSLGVESPKQPGEILDQRKIL